MKISIKAISISGKVFLITIILYLLLWSSYFLPFPKDYRGNPCGVNINKYTESILLYGMFLAAFIALVELTASFIAKTSKISIFIIFLLSLILLATAVLMALSSARSRSRDASALAAMASIRPAQEIFHDQKGRYANTQEELIEAGIINEKLRNPLTKEEFTDKDGYGIEGGDDDPQTWSVAAFIPTREFTGLCKRVREGYWYTCNQIHQDWVCQKE